MSGGLRLQFKIDRVDRGARMAAKDSSSLSFIIPLSIHRKGSPMTEKLVLATGTLHELNQRYKQQWERAECLQALSIPPETFTRLAHR